jgi:predicted  nucleic acid-binding Zn-ribbon protein
VANAGSGKSKGRTAKPRRSAAKPKRSAAAEVERLAAGKEASDDRVFALTHRVATLEGRERDLNELIIGHRERVAALQAERDALASELEGRQQEVATARQRERDLNEQLTKLLERSATLEAERESIGRGLDDQKQRAIELDEQLAGARDHIAGLEASRDRLSDELERKDSELSSQLTERSERIAALEAGHEALKGELDTARRDVAALHERERDVQQRTVVLHEQVAKLEAHREALERTLAKEQNNRSILKEREAELEEERRSLAELRRREGELQKDLTDVRGRETELRRTIGGIREQVSGLETQRTSLTAERDELTAELNRLTARLEQLESSRTYRMMRFTWRARKRLRHPFQRRARPALTKAQAAKRKKPAELEKPAAVAPASPAPASDDRPKLKPIPTPAMRRSAKPAAEAKVETPKPAPPEKAAVRPAPAVTEEDIERERWLARAQAPPADVRQLRVAGVLDEMSAACFEPDCDLLRIESEGWAEALEAHEPHLLLVESTWQGNHGAWQYMVASYTHPDYIGLPNLKALIAWCRERDIPTVFWNKEDPVHFERFKEAAALFDYIFTSDANCIDRYAALEREGTGPISALQFAAQPRVHNPIGAPVERSGSPVFAGAYYRDRHIDRQKSLQMLLDAAMPFGLEIYDRRFGHEDKAFGFPERFTERVKGALPYDQMIDAYKTHRIFLNVNSVTDSPTMFSRRVFELLACGTAVVSTESVGVERTLGDVVSMVETSKEATQALAKLQDDDFWRELTQRGRRTVMGEHTYRHRLAEIASALGFNVTPYPGEEVAALALVDDVEQARRFRAVVSSIAAQETRPAELLIGSHTSVAGDLQELQGDGGEIRVRVVQQNTEASRSQRYRELAALAASPWLAILHPAHSYGEHHLTDLVLTTRFAEADVIGNASFETTEGSGAVDRSLEHRFVDSVHPHSVLVKRELVARRGWPDDATGAGESLSDWFREGVRIYSGDAGNFRADAALGLPGRAAAAGSERDTEG